MSTSKASIVEGRITLTRDYALVYLLLGVGQ